MKFNIHKKVLILVLGMGFTAFLALGFFSLLGIKVVQKDMAAMSEEFSRKSADYSDDISIAQLKDTLGELAESKAQFVDREMSTTREDAEILAEAMTYIISHSDNYLPKTLPDPRTDSIHNAEPYLIYAPDIRDNVTPALQNEIALAANVRDILTGLLKGYEGFHATAFVGSKDGWYICARLVDRDLSENKPISFSNERIYEFDPRKRPWYIAAEKAGAPVISDLYGTVEANGYQQIGASAPFYDASGNFAGVVGLDASSDEIYALIDNTIGTDNCSFVLNRRGEIIFATLNSKVLDGQSGDLRESSDETLAQAATRMINGENDVVPVTVGDENFYLAFAPMSETKWSFGLLVPEAQVLSSLQDTRNYFRNEVENIQNQLRDEYAYIQWLVLAVLFWLVAILVMLGRNLSARFVKPINALSDGVSKIFGGDLEKNLEIHTGDEIEHLAISFNAMIAELKKYRTDLTTTTAEKERIATGLDVATQIQASLLPENFSVDKRVDLLATMTPAKEVGGDFYDFYKLDENHLAITVADVSGKGIPAALFMVIAKTVLNNFALSLYQNNGLAEVVEKSNDKLCVNNETMMFVTAFVGVLDLETGEFVFVNAGHNPPVIYRAEQNHCEFLDVKKNFVLGPMDGISFVEQKINFNAGDLMFVYTDGVTEALNVANEEYLPDRLIAFMNTTDCRIELQTLLKNIRGDVSEHVGEAEQSDDITLFALRFNGCSIDADA